jgi:hypothetical protein
MVDLALITATFARDRVAGQFAGRRTTRPTRGRRTR